MESSKNRVFILEIASPKVSKLKMGDVLDPETQMGSLISKEHLESVNNYVKEAIRDGARDGSEFKLQFEDGSIVTLQLADPGSSAAVHTNDNQVEYLIEADNFIEVRFLRAAR